MVNSVLKSGRDDGPPIDPEAALAIAYAPRSARAALTTLWRFDARLGAIVRTTREPMIGQMRLTWWHDATIGVGQVVGEPLAEALATLTVSRGLLAQMVDGWEALLDGDDDAALQAYAEGRGGGLFAASAELLGSTAVATDGGAGWALIDLARHHSRAEVAARAVALAGEYLASAPRRFDRPARPLGALIVLARRDLDGIGVRGSPSRMLRMVRLALTGR